MSDLKTTNEKEANKLNDKWNVPISNWAIDKQETECTKRLDDIKYNFANFTKIQAS